MTRMRSLKIKAPAKINLFLEVTGRRPDGYHDLTTLFAKISLSDELSFNRTARGLRLTASDKAGLIPLKAEDNIVYKAARAFFEAFGIEPSVRINLVKKIPVGAGLGGGSSDAAAALKGLCLLYGINVKKRLKKLKAIALALGSDVPFFLTDDAFSSGRGRGEVLSPVKMKGRGPFIVLVYPGVPVYTGPVYRALKPVGAAEKKRNLKKFDSLLKAFKAGKPLKDWSALLFNRLEGPVLPLHPAVLRAKRDLIRAGAPAVLMSGSGASVFALTESSVSARKIFRALKRPGYRVFLPNFLLKS